MTQITLAVSGSISAYKAADIIVANDLNKITEKGHEAYLVEKDRVTKAHSKVEIAQLLYQHIHREEKT